MSPIVTRKRIELAAQVLQPHHQSSYHSARTLTDRWAAHLDDEELLSELHDRAYANQLDSHLREEERFQTFLQRDQAWRDLRLAEPFPHAAVKNASAYVLEAIRDRLGVPDLNPVSPEQLARALERRGVMRHEVWNDPRHATPQGARSTSVEVLRAACVDRELVGLFELQIAYRQSELEVKWFRRSQENGIDFGRTVTFRLRSSPNVQNLSKTRRRIVCGDDELREALAAGERPIFIPASFRRDFVDPPHLRSLISAPDGHVLLCLDYAGQEMRLLAELSGDESLQSIFRSDRKVDIYAEMARLAGLDEPRRTVKTVVLAGIYGQGPAGRAARLGLDPTDEQVLEKMRRLEFALYEPFPRARSWMESLSRDPDRHYVSELATFGVISHQANSDHDGRRMPLAWSGRPVFVEARGSDGRVPGYKLVNHVVQGSAGDMLRRVCVESTDRLEHARIAATIHDELVLVAPIAAAESALAEAVQLMEAVGTRAGGVPMVVDGGIQARWAV